jgi:predicted RNase H-like nuclease (RuvC/YqgF family)
MSHQKFDSKTTKKLLTNYQNTISKYSSENEQLTRQLEDLKTTLTLNQNLLYDFIKSSVGEDEKINNLINESKSLWKENESLIKQKNDLEMKTAKLQELIEDTPTQIREEINNLNIQNNKMKNELVQKDNTIKKLKNDLEKARKNALFKTARTEVLVTEPTKTNVEINHELLNTKTILTKVSAMHNAEKKRATNLDKEVKKLQEEVVKLRKTAIDLRDEFNNKVKQNENGNNKDGTPSDINFPLNIKGFNFLVDKNDDENEEEEEEEEQESENSSEEEDSYEGKKKPKSKQKELDQLTDQYNKLKKQNEEYEKKINNYKKIYKDLKNKINNLKQMPNSNERGQKKYAPNNNGIEPTTDDTNSHPNA